MAMLVACGDDDGGARDSGIDGSVDGGEVGAGTCEDPIVLVAESEVSPGIFRLEGTTEGARNREEGSCSENRAPEVVFRWTAPAEGFVRADLSGPDPVLYVREGCAEDTEVACNDDVNDDVLNSRVIFRAQAGVTYSFVADSFDGEEAGAFVLDIDTTYEPSITIPNGTWVSRGYGLILDASDESVALYEETSISCIRVLDGSIADLDALIAEVVQDGELLRVRPRGTLAPYTFDRAPLPERCQDGGTPVFGSPGYERDALQLWDIMSATFDEHYAHFARRGVDWSARSASLRSTLDTESSDLRLFDAMSEIFGELRDGHVSLEAGESEFASDEFPIVARLREEHTMFGSGMAFDAYLGEAFQAYLANTNDALVDGVDNDTDEISWGRLASDVGYLRLLGIETDDEEAFASTLDSRLAALSDTHTLVIDLRINTGGSDSTSLILASRFAAERTLALTKAARNGEGTTDPFEVWVEPAGTRYEGRVLVLTSESTVSAAEILVLMLRELPQVVVMGQPTNGELSDIFGRTLPNGWSFGLSNEIYTAADGEVYEAIGIPVDVSIEEDFFARADRLAGVDRGLAEVVRWLSENPPE